MIKMDKVRKDVDSIKAMPDGKPTDWLKQPWNTHHWTDMFVETSRAAPYLMGHIWAVYVPVSLVLIIWHAIT